MKNIQFIAVYSGLFIVATVLAITVQTEFKAGDCNSAEALATMPRAQAEACFSWDRD